jgi:hypothetical protein
VIAKGHFNFEPYFYGNTAYGTYDRHWQGHSKQNFYNASGQGFMWYGFANRWDFMIGPQFSWNYTSGASHWVLNDLPLALEYQILSEKPRSGRPAIKLAAHSSIPIGRYQKLNPHAKDTEIGGSGSWLPGITLTFMRLFHPSKNHYLCGYFSLDYTIPSAVHVKGFNAYGGGHHTQGTVYPGAAFTTTLSFEYTLTHNWVFAIDSVYLHINHSHFKGRKGKTNGISNTIGNPSSEAFSLAPAIEYNWSEKIGIIAGVWFSVAGRNSLEFANGIIAINIFD